MRGLDSSIKYAIRNLNPKSYEEALALAQNKELELNGCKPRQAAASSYTPYSGKSSTPDMKKQDSNKIGPLKKPKMTLDEKAKVCIEGGFLTEAEMKTYIAE